MTDTVKDAPPITEEDLKRLGPGPDDTNLHGGCMDCGTDFEILDRLIADYRRLRSDEWLELAVREIFRLDDMAVEKLLRTVEAHVGRDAIEGPRREKALAALAILRKHRDGAA